MLQVIAMLFFFINGEAVKVSPVRSPSSAVLLDTFTDF